MSTESMPHVNSETESVTQAPDQDIQSSEEPVYSANEIRAIAQAETQEEHDAIAAKRPLGRAATLGVVGGITGALVAGGGIFMAVESNHSPEQSSNPTNAGTTPATYGSGDILSTPQSTGNAVTNPTSSPYASPSNTEALKSAPAAPEALSSYSVEQLEAMSVDQYNNLPHADRMVLIKHFLEQAKDVSLSYGKDIYEFNPLDVASKSNTPQEVMKQIEFEMQMALLQSASTSAADNTIDKNNALKAVGAAAYDTSKASMPAYMISERITPLTTTTELADKYDKASEHLPIQTMEDPITHKTIEYRTIEFVDQKGAPHIAKVTYAQLDTSKGIWQLLSLV